MKHVFWGTMLSLVFLVTSIAGLSDYGINEDSPGHFLRGQAYLRLFFTGKSTYDFPPLPSPVLFIPAQRISLYKLNAWEGNLAPVRAIGGSPDGSTIQQFFRRYQEQFGRRTFYLHESWNAKYFMQADGPGHPPISDILAAATNRVLYEKLGIVGDIESYHLFIIATAALAILTVFLFTTWGWGWVAGVGAALSLSMYPLFFAEAHFNIKDIPLTAFFAASVALFAGWAVTRRIWYLLGFVLATFLALGTKLNGVFIPVILFLWLLLARKYETIRRFVVWRTLLALLGATVAITAAFILTWPWLWDAPFQRILETLIAYKEIGSTDFRIQDLAAPQGPWGITLHGILLVIFTTPLVTFLLFTVGLISLRNTAKEKVLSSLVFIWLLVPLFRVIRPGAEVFGSTRQFLEFLPAMAIIAGIGLAQVIRVISVGWKKRPRAWMLQLLVLGLYGALLLIPLIRYHPNQNFFFNTAIGGSKGATRQNLTTWETPYDNPYRQAVSWLNANAPEGARLAYLDGTMLAISPLWLRDDIAFGSFFSGLSQSGEFIISLVYPQEPTVFPYRYLETFLTPVFEISAGGVPIMRIWRNSPEYTKPGFKAVTTLTAPAVKRSIDERLGEYWEMEIESGNRLVAVFVSLPQGSCSEEDGFVTIDTKPSIPYRTQSARETMLFFPAEEGRVLRYYGLRSDSCLLRGTAKEIQVIAQPR